MFGNLDLIFMYLGPPEAQHNAAVPMLLSQELSRTAGGTWSFQVETINGNKVY